MAGIWKGGRKLRTSSSKPVLSQNTLVYELKDVCICWMIPFERNTLQTAVILSPANTPVEPEMIQGKTDYGC